MSSFRRIEANRRNALRSTGPRSRSGKQRARANALRHGLTGETVITVLEDAEEYQAFEAKLISDYDPRTVLERELVVRLASLAWRLRRATAIETGLLQMQAETVQNGTDTVEPQTAPNTIDPIHRLFLVPVEEPRMASPPATANGSLHGIESREPDAAGQSMSVGARETAQSFWRLVNLNSEAFALLGRYEHSLWRHFARTLATLELIQGRPNLRGSAWQRSRFGA